MPGPSSVMENAQDGQSAAVLGPFTARDLALFAGVLVTFIGSLLPLVQRGSALNLWNAQNLYFMGIGILLPLVLAGLFVWRRLSPKTSIRVGSFSLDQLASIVAAFACSYFFVYTVTVFTPGAIVGFVGGVILLASTVLAPVIRPFAGDFAGRAEVPAHVVARDAVAPIQKPKPAKPAPGQPKGTPFPAGARGQKAPAAPAPWAGSVASDAAPTAPEDSRAAGAGVSSAGAAAAAAGAAGVAAAGSSVAALAAGAMAAQGERANNASAPRDGAATAGAATAGAQQAQAGAAAAAGQPEAQPSQPDAQPGQTIGAPSSAAPAGESADEAHFIGRHDAAASGLAETPSGAPAEAPVGAEADDAVVLGDADGEAYGAPGPAERLEPTVASSAEHTAAMPSASELRSDQPEAAHETAPTRVSPVQRPAEPEPEPQAGPPTQLAPAVDRSDGFEATRDYEEPEPAYEAFWFAVNQPRAALDPQSGLPLFTLDPGQWILALEDRGDEFLVQSQDGRVGVLRDLSGIERG